MNNIRSTILIEIKTLRYVSNICLNHKTTLNKIIGRAMHNMVQREFSRNRLKTFRTVQYQERGGKYTLVHYSVDPKIYESLQDIRKLRKSSISKLLSDFIKLYMMRISDNDCCFKIFFSKPDSNQIDYRIISQFNKENKFFNFIIRAKLE